MKKLFVSFTVITALCAVFTSCSENGDDNSLKAITLSANGSSTLLKPTETLKLTVAFFPENTTERDVVWSSSNDNFATVTDGLVTAVGEGNVRIKATSRYNNSISDEFSVTVTAPDMVIVTKSGAVEGVWAKNSVVYVNDQIWVEHGKTLTVEEGVTIIMQDGQVGASHAPIEFYVDGKLHLKGTAANPILVTVEESKRTEANRYAGLWGGFVGGNQFEELLFDHVTVEYTGALCVANSQSVQHGLNVADKDKTAQLLTNNPDGKIVVINSTFRYAESDAMYFMGGKAIVAGNTIHSIGESDNDGINMKAGVQVDIAYNLCFSVNSNGMKLSSAGQSPDRHQAMIRAYNNTIVNSGWRRTKNLKGGAIYLEKNALASLYNNLIVNSKLMTKTPKLNQPNPDNGADWNSIVDYNFYASGSQTLTNARLVTIDGSTVLTAFEGYTLTDDDYWHNWDSYVVLYGPTFPLIDKNSLVASTPGAPDPMFVNFGFNTVALDRDLYDPSWDFHVQAGSPVINGAEGKSPRSEFSGAYAPYFGATGLTVCGAEYKTPAPSAQYGAFGTK